VITAAAELPFPAAAVDLRTSIRPTVAEVDLGAIQRNFQRLRQTVGRGVAVWGVIKADAYGHGAVAVARALEPVCDALAVSLVEEGFELRAAGCRAPIVVLGAFYNRHHDEVLDNGLTPVIYDRGDLDHFAVAAARRGARAALHLKVDTGMSRLGFSTGELPAALDRALALASVEVAGLCTHLASADVVDRTVTDAALDSFEACLRAARDRGLGGLTNHAANSAAAIRFPRARFDAVRPGLALYGALPAAEVELGGLEPALRLSTRIMALHEVAPGTPVSYGGTWRAAYPSRIATLPIGYADGYPRHVHGASTLVRGVRAPIVGSVCMDMLMVDVTAVPGAALGDVVTLIGRDGGESITVDDLALWAGTVNYEILCGVSKRVPRIYTGAPRAARPSPASP
jgi:alanine racemase